MRIWSAICIGIREANTRRAFKYAMAFMFVCKMYLLQMARVCLAFVLGHDNCIYCGPIHSSFP